MIQYPFLHSLYACHDIRLFCGTNIVFRAPSTDQDDVDLMIVLATRSAIFERIPPLMSSPCICGNTLLDHAVVISFVLCKRILSVTSSERITPE